MGIKSPTPCWVSGFLHICKIISTKILFPPTSKVYLPFTKKNLPYRCSLPYALAAALLHSLGRAGFLITFSIAEKVTKKARQNKATTHRVQNITLRLIRRSLFCYALARTGAQFCQPSAQLPHGKNGERTTATYTRMQTSSCNKRYYKSRSTLAPHAELRN